MSFSPIQTKQNSYALIVLAIAAILCGCSSVDGSPKPPISASNPGGTGTDASSDLEKRMVHLPKDAEREAGLSMEEAKNRRLDICVDVTGEVLANANTTTHVTTPVTGRI